MVTIMGDFHPDLPAGLDHTCAFGELSPDPIDLDIHHFDVFRIAHSGSRGVRNCLGKRVLSPFRRNRRPPWATIANREISSKVNL